MPPKLLANIHRLPDGPYFGAWSVFEIRSAFQPLFRFRGGKVEIGAYECLVRPFRNGEAISPGNFFPMVPHQDKVEVESLMRFVHLMNAGAFLDPASLVFVNFDPSLFVERILVEKALDDLRAVLFEAGVDGKRLVCEMTEQKTASDDLLFDFVQALRRQGYRIAVDDYGSDDSDMERIRRLKPDIIKFDAHWIMRLMDSNAGYALLESMVHRFRDERITTVFEGIEEHWQLELAERAGADFVQGFVLARPELAPGNFSQFRSTATLEPPAFRPSQPVAAPNRAAKTFGRRTSL
jgi:EAL domain-containing protein (putative c-di-GMP-specific phosphodiesterase class I)